MVRNLIPLCNQSQDTQITMIVTKNTMPQEMDTFAQSVVETPYH